jgi:uncharacterized protein (DUF1778 family)
MTATKETRKSRNVTFRLTDDEYAKVEKAATAGGDDPNNWCRKAAIGQLSEHHTFTKNEHLIYQEIALLRFLIGHGFKLLFSRNDETKAAWAKFTQQAYERSDEIVAHILSRRERPS